MITSLPYITLLLHPLFLISQRLWRFMISCWIPMGVSTGTVGGSSYALSVVLTVGGLLASECARLFSGGYYTKTEGFSLSTGLYLLSQGGTNRFLTNLIKVLSCFRAIFQLYFY